MNENNKKEERIEKIVLGIDVGTSSVKCSIIKIIKNSLFKQQNHHNSQSYEILSSSKRSYNQAKIQKSNKSGESQQNVYEILECLSLALKKLNGLESIESIAFSCQMHGIILWNKQNIFSNDDYYICNLKIMQQPQPFRRKVPNRQRSENQNVCCKKSCNFL